MARRVQMGKAFVVVGAENRALYKALGNAERRVERFGAKVGAAAASFARIGAAIIAPFVIATRTGLEFEKTMAEVAAVTGAVGDEFDRLEKTARKLGETTSFTASEVASAMAQLGRAGFEANEIIAAIPTTLALARASGLDMGSVAEIMADVSRAFGIAAGDIAKVADAITFTANNATTNIELMGESLKYVAPAAAAAGQELETVTAALGVLANRAIKGSQAGTALSAVLVKLADVKVQDTLADFGVEVRTSTGEMRDLVAIMRDLDNALSVVGDVERLGILFELFGKRGLRAAVNLTALNREVDQFRQRTRDAEGTTAQTADIMEGRLNRALNQALSAFESLQITISRAVEPTFKEWLDTLKKVFNQVNKFVDENQELVRGLLDVGIAAGGLAIAFGTLAIASKGVALAMAGSQGIAGAATLAAKGIALVNKHALAASIVGARNIIPSFTGIATAFQGITTASIATKLAAIKTGIAIKASLAIPFAAVALTIGGVVGIVYKLWRLLDDTDAIRKTQNETDRLNALIAKQTDEIRKLNKERKLGQYFTEEQATRDIRDRIIALKEMGKTSGDVQKQLKQDIYTLTKVVEQEYDKRSVFSKEDFEGELNQNRLLLQATVRAYNEDLAAKIKTEKEKRDAALRIRLDLLQKTKDLQKKFEEAAVTRAGRQAEEAERQAIEGQIEKNAKATAERLAERIREAQYGLQKQRAAAERELRQARLQPTKENVDAAEREIAAYNKQERELDNLVKFRKQAAARVAEIAAQQKREAESTLAELDKLQQRITLSMEVNPFVEGAESQFDQLTDTAKAALLKVMEEIKKAREFAKAGLLPPEKLKEGIERARKLIGQALGARRQQTTAAVGPQVTAFGTFSGREAAGTLGSKALSVAEQQLDQLKTLVRLAKAGKSPSYAK